jgi:hypothetical protein
MAGSLVDCTGLAQLTTTKKAGDRNSGYLSCGGVAYWGYDYFNYHRDGRDGYPLRSSAGRRESPKVPRKGYFSDTIC